MARPAEGAKNHSATANASVPPSAAAVARRSTSRLTMRSMSTSRAARTASLTITPAIADPSTLLSTAVTSTSSRPPARSSMKRAICRSEGVCRNDSSAKTREVTATAVTAATTRTSGTPSEATSHTASRPTNTIAAAVSPPRAQASSSARRCQRARTSARIPRSSLTRSVIDDFPISRLRLASPLGNTSAEDCFPGQGRQHDEQPYLPPALPVLHVAGGILRFEQVGATDAIDGIRKFLDGGRRRIRFAQFDSRHRLTFGAVPGEVTRRLDRKRHECRVQRKAAPFIVEVGGVNHQPALAHRLLG